MANDDEWQQVAAAVRSRRDAMRLSLEKVSGISGVSKTTWGKLEHAAGTAYWSDSITKIERTLGWEAGSIERLRRGLDPIIADSADRPPPGSVQSLLNTLSELTDGELSAVEGFARQLIRARALQRVSENNVVS